VNNVFLASYKCYSPAFHAQDKSGVNKGNKIIMPTSALTELGRLQISYPMTFMIQNPAISMKTYCGVLEFSAEEGVCHIPIWMMENLCLNDGDDIVIRNIGLNKGTFIEVRPHKTAFIKLNNGDPKAILEEELTNYATLNKGETINIQYAGVDYKIDVLQCKPND